MSETAVVILLSIPTVALVVVVCLLLRSNRILTERFAALSIAENSTRYQAMMAPPPVAKRPEPKAPIVNRMEL